MKGYTTTIVALHCTAAVFAIIVIGITGDFLAATNKAAKQVNSFLEQQMQWMQGMGFNTDGLMQQAGAGRKGPEKSRLGFLMFVALAGLLLDGALVVLQLLPRAYDVTLGALARGNTAAWVQRPFFEYLLSALWSVMWLAGAAAISHLFEGVSDCAGGKACDLANTLLAFSWLSWLLWCASTALMGWVWGRGLSAAHGTSTAARGAADTAAPGVPAATTAVDVEKAAAPASEVKSGVPMSTAPHVTEAAKEDNAV